MNETQNQNGGNQMGNVDTGTAGVLALLADTARAGRGGGYWGGGEGALGGYGPFASPGANAVRVNRNADLIRSGIDRVSDQSEETRRVLQAQNQANQTMDGFNRICDRLNNDSTANRDLIFQQELRNSDRLAALQAEMNANARTAADCCCDIKVQAANDKAEILARMEALSKEGIARDLDRAERELIALKTQVACGCTTGCTQRCHDHRG